MKKQIQFAKFDAILNTDVCDARNNADLTLRLRLGFRQVNPTGGAATGTHNDYGRATGTPRKIVKWTDAEWKQWKANFVSSAQRFWDQKFWLSNNFGFFGYVAANQAYFPNFFCRMELLGSDSTVGTHHHVIDVVRLDKSETWFGSHSTLYDSLDTTSVQKATDQKGKPIMQRAHVHEVGHLLGLGHVDIGKAHCPATGNTNASSCYGIADVDKHSVMGAGMRLDPEHADPWMKAAEAFIAQEFVSEALKPIAVFAPVLGSPSSKVPRPTVPLVRARLTAHMKRIYPRTKQEVEKGTNVTSR
jgi:hypothetical protein